ncbi:MAG: V-type ATP synthase subunit F [Candidatus Bathyarchaeota archaeon B23]|nr:MAG: V-type ATP synthase subunit F [Candidatus Bathyarchaeota archaeon B23]
MSIAVVGPSPFITCFTLIGAVGFEAEDGERADEVLRRLIEEDYKLIILPERFAEETRELRQRVMAEEGITPVFALIPDFTLETGMRMEELRRVISLAVGTKLEL